MTSPDRETGQPGLSAVLAGLDRGYRTLGEMVYEVIKEAILTGALAPVSGSGRRPSPRLSRSRASPFVPRCSSSRPRVSCRFGAAAELSSAA